MINLIIIGAGGNGQVVSANVTEINKKDKKINFLGFLDDTVKTSKNVKILGKINNSSILKYMKQKNTFFFWSLVSLKLKKKSPEKLKSLNIPISKFTNIIHPTANISQNVKIGKSVNISAYVNISPNVIIKNYVNIFAQSMIGHDTNIGNFSYIANNAVLGANIQLKEGAYIGMNATVRENVVLGNWSTVGMGSVVLNNVSHKTTVVGNPAKIYS